MTLWVIGCLWNKIKKIAKTVTWYTDKAYTVFYYWNMLLKEGNLYF